MKRVSVLGLLLGTLLTAAPSCAQPFGAYVSFDRATTAHLVASNASAAQPTGALTLEAWVRLRTPLLDDAEDCRSLFGKDYTRSYWVGVCHTGTQEAVLRSYTHGSTSAYDAGVIPVGEWTHIAITSDGAIRTHYINGLPAGAVADLPPTASPSPLQIGSDVSWPYVPPADMDELRIWTVARTQAQIGDLIRTSITEGFPGLLSVFPFEHSGEDVVGSADTTSAGGTVTFLDAPSSTRTFFVPVVLKNQYSSEITITNRGTAPATVSMEYTATSGGGSGTSNDFLLGSGQQFVAADATDLLRSLGLHLATSGTLLGTVRVTFRGLSTADAAAVTVRTGTDTSNPVGRAGLAYAGVAVEKTFTSAVLLAGLAYGPTSVRTNLAIQNAGSIADNDVTLRVTVYNVDGSTRRVLPDTTLPPGGFRQFSSDELGISGGLFSGSARVERVSTLGRFYAYAVLNDQTNSDGSFVPPVDPALLTSARLVVPAIVESGSYTTDVVFANAGSTDRNVVLTLSCPGCPANAQSGFVVPAHGTVPIASLAQAMRASYAIPQPMGVGTVTLTAQGGSSVQDLVAMARTSSVVGTQGAFGVAYPGLRAVQGATTTAWISAMQQNATNRSNIAFVNLGDVDAHPIALHVEIWNGDTGERVTDFDDPRLSAIPPLGFVQINAFLSALAPGIANAYLRVTRISGGNAFLAYGVVNDGGAPGQRTGDGAYVAMDVP